MNQEAEGGMRWINPFAVVAGIVNRFPVAILVAMVALAIVAMMFMGAIPPYTISDEYMDKNSPEGVVFDAYSARYMQDTYILFIHAGDITDPALLSDLLILEDQIRRINQVNSTITIADVVAQSNGGVIPGTSAEVRAIIDRLPPDTRQQFVPDPQTLLGYIVLDQGLPTDASFKIEPVVVKTIAEATLPPGVSIEATGNTPLNFEIAVWMTVNFILLVIGAMVLMLIVKYLLWSKIRFWILPVVLLTFGLFYTFGVMGVLGIPANDGAVAAFPILLGLGIDYAVQFHSRFDDECHVHDRNEALSLTVTAAGPAVLTALVATSLGFLAMFISPIPMIRTFAMVSIIGIVCCYLTALFGFGAFAHVLKYTPKPPGDSIADRIMTFYDTGLTAISSGVVKIAVPIVIISILVALVGISLDHGIPVDASQQSLAPSDMPAVVTADKVESIAGSLTPLPLYVQGLDPRTIPGIKWTDRLCGLLEKNYDKISSINSMSSVVRSYNNGVLPENQAELDRVLASIPPDQLRTYQVDDTTSIIMINTLAMEIDEQVAFSDNVERDIAWLGPPPGAMVTPTGSFTLYTILTKQVIENKDQMTFLGFVLIFVFLLLVYRKGIALTPLVPIICVIGWNPIAMVLLGQSYSILTAVLGSMTIGIGSEYTILIMERYLEEFQESHDRIEAMKRAVRKVGTAVTVSGLVTAAGFSALMMSSFPILSGFGLATVIVVILSLVSAVVVMPATLVLASRFGAAKSTPEPSKM
jgi:hydrophobe/amphiphile efflux-3 (HAE3) family protein